jgi:hypothetical protein
LMEEAQADPPQYQTYSYARRADVYALDLPSRTRERMAREIERIAPRGLRAPLRRVFGSPGALRLIYQCPR